MMDLIRPLDEMPLVKLTAPFVASLRDKIAEQHGRRQANYVLSVISVTCEFGRERGFVKENPVKGIKRVRRSRDLPRSNRPWSESERRFVLENIPSQLKVPVALAMFTGLRKGDILGLKKSAIRDSRIWRRTNKTGQEVYLPLHPDLDRLIRESPQHDAITLAATSRGMPWTESGFNSTFIKAIAKLEQDKAVEPGLTFHGLRHTVGTLLIEAGFDIDTVRRWLGQKTLAMAIHYSQTADTSERMREINEKFDPLGSKKRTNSV
jgi:integrase